MFGCVCDALWSPFPDDMEWCSMGWTDSGWGVVRVVKECTHAFRDGTSWIYYVGWMNLIFLLCQCLLGEGFIILFPSIFHHLGELQKEEMMVLGVLLFFPSLLGNIPMAFKVSLMMKHLKRFVVMIIFRNECKLSKCMIYVQKEVGVHWLCSFIHRV